MFLLVGMCGGSGYVDMCVCLDFMSYFMGYVGWFSSYCVLVMIMWGV